MHKVTELSLDKVKIIYMMVRLLSPLMMLIKYWN